MAADPLVRAGVPLRVTVIHDEPPREAATLVLALLQNGRELARCELHLDDPRCLRLPAHLVLTEPQASDGNGPAPELVATLASGGEQPQIARCTIDSREHRLVRLDRLDRAFASERDPLPSLWLEQAAAFSQASSRQALDALDERCQALIAWQTGARPQPTPGTHDGAFRDPVDGSVQPYRLHLAANSRRLALILGAPVPAAKTAWRGLSEVVLAAAAANGVTVLEAYPAGDQRWDGVAPRRALIALAAVQDWLHDSSPPALIGWGAGSAATTRLAAGNPTAWAAVVPTLDHDTWHHVIAGTPVVTAFNDPPLYERAPLACYAAQSFAVVIGSGEHAAAAEANRRLGEAFLRAWVAHAQGAPPWAFDQDFNDRTKATTLVLIGSPRSNRTLAALVADGLDPLITWDERLVRLGDQQWLRAERRGLAVLRPHPRDRQRRVLILDGSPLWEDRGLPLAGMPTLVVGSQVPGGDPVVARWLGCGSR